MLTRKLQKIEDDIRKIDHYFHFFMAREQKFHGNKQRNHETRQEGRLNKLFDALLM